MFCRSPKARAAGFRRLGRARWRLRCGRGPSGPESRALGRKLAPALRISQNFFRESLPPFGLFGNRPPCFFSRRRFVPTAVPILISVSANEKIRKHRDRHRGLGHNSGFRTLLAEKMGRGCGVFLFISSRVFDNASRGVLHMDLRNLLYCARGSGKSARAVAPRSSSAAARARSALLFCCRGRIIDIVFFLWNFRTAHRS